MTKFIAVYTAPVEGLEAWAKMDKEAQKVEEAKMMEEWNAWTKKHPEMSSGETLAIGKTKRVKKGEVTDTKNDLMMYSIIEAESHEAAAEIFKDCPHFQIPNATIDVMPISSVPGM